MSGQLVTHRHDGVPQALRTGSPARVVRRRVEPRDDRSRDTAHDEEQAGKDEHGVQGAAVGVCDALALRGRARLRHDQLRLPSREASSPALARWAWPWQALALPGARQWAEPLGQLTSLSAAGFPPHETDFRCQSGRGAKRVTAVRSDSSSERRTGSQSAEQSPPLRPAHFGAKSSEGAQLARVSGRAVAWGLGFCVVLISAPWPTGGLRACAFGRAVRPPNAASA